MAKDRELNWDKNEFFEKKQSTLEEIDRLKLLLRTEQETLKKLRDERDTLKTMLFDQIDKTNRCIHAAEAVNEKLVTENKSLLSKTKQLEVEKNYRLENLASKIYTDVIQKTLDSPAESLNLTNIIEELESDARVAITAAEAFFKELDSTTKKESENGNSEKR